jgi:hypothetical protein
MFTHPFATADKKIALSYFQEGSKTTLFFSAFVDGFVIARQRAKLTQVKFDRWVEAL